MKLTGARVPALDGLRGIAVLLVIAGHFSPSTLGSGGNIGVTMFFTLSGFLITTLLLEHPGDFRGFYARRARRLLPALGFLVAVMCAVGIVSRWDVLATATYSTNWVRAFGGDVGFLDHTWSLSIEEQFYLVWPFVVWVLRRRPRALLAACLTGAAVSLSLRLLLWNGGTGLDRVSFGTDTRAEAVLLGCALAVWLTRRDVRRSPRVAEVAVIVLAGLCLIESYAVSYLVLPTVTAVVTVAALASVGAGRTWLATPVLRYVGRRSYGLYLWHVPLVAFTGPWPVTTRLILVAVSFVMAEVSWQLVERWFLARRRTAPPAGQSVRAVELVEK